MASLTEFVNKTYLLINGIRKDNLKKNLLIEKKDDNETHIMYFPSEENIELEYIWNLDEKTTPHLRGNIVELYVDDKKTVEIQVISASLTVIDNENSKLIFRFSDRDVKFKINCRVKSFLNRRTEPPWEMETVFKSHNNVRYHFIEAVEEEHSDKLLIVFSALGKEYTFNYNYMQTLEDIPVNKLFILDDFGNEGSYYIGFKRDFSIESSVMALIMSITSELNISTKNITTVGSSKGGYSALYFALKYSFGNVLTMAPSLYLGDFLHEHHPNIMKYIYGDFSEGGAYYLNNLIFRLVQANRQTIPNISIMVGTSDSRKDVHILPFVDYLEKKGINYSLDLVNGVDHSELKFFAPEYIKNYLSKIYKLEPIPNIFFTKIKLAVDADNRLKIETNAIGEGIIYAYYLYHDNQLIEKVLYSASNFAFLDVNKNGRYRVRVFAKNNKNQILTKSSNSINFTM